MANPTISDELATIVGRKVLGIDCTEDESAVILRYFDEYQVDPVEAHHDPLTAVFPSEFDQWCDEVSAGVRPWQASDITIITFSEAVDNLVAAMAEMGSALERKLADWSKPEEGPK